MTATNALVVTTLYPNKIQFGHGIFIETRIVHLKQSGKVNIKVIAPVPWFPFKTRLFPEYSKLVDVPKYEVRKDIEIYHPRYIVIPKIGMLLTPFFLAFSIYAQARKLYKDGFRFDLIDAHYYYPDGVAAAIVSKVLKFPLLITARGTDINLISSYALPRKMIVWASRVAKFNLAVCNALRLKMLAVGVAESSIRVLRNGVDLSLFRPLERDRLRQQWQVQGSLLISVGNLIELKGHDLILKALTKLPDYQLFIVGDGEWDSKLKNLAEQLGVLDRVRFLGKLTQQQLAEIYNCADVLVLASSREGWANVLLEAMACGTPVVATDVGGTAEVVRSPEAGVLCRDRGPQSIAEAVKQLLSNYPDRVKTRLYAERFSWDETTAAQLKLYSSITSDDAVD